MPRVILSLTLEDIVALVVITIVLLAYLIASFYLWLARRSLKRAPRQRIEAELQEKL